MLEDAKTLADQQASVLDALHGMGPVVSKRNRHLPFLSAQVKNDDIVAMYYKDGDGWETFDLENPDDDE